MRTVAPSIRSLLLSVAVVAIGLSSVGAAAPADVRPIYVYDSLSAATTTPTTVSLAAACVYDPTIQLSGRNIGVALGSGAAEEPLAAEAFHYTSSRFVQAIAQEGLRPGSYATAEGDLSPLQAQIDLALPPNRGLLGGLVRVDLAGLRAAGYDVPEFTRVGRSFNMPGGGTEIQFPYAVPPRFLQVVRP